MKKKHPILLKIGGSLLIPDGTINTPYVKSLCQYITQEARSGQSFFLQIGGGSLSRTYIDAASYITDNSLDQNQLDWLALRPTHLNAYLFLSVFQELAHPTIITDYAKIEHPKAPIVIAAGWKPGHSTDYNAVILARDYHINQIIKLSNTDYVYDSDPAKNSDAKPYKQLTWAKYRSLIGDKWTPGQHVPFDPIASKLADDQGVELLYLKGSDISNLKNAVDRIKYVGTIIK